MTTETYQEYPGEKTARIAIPLDLAVAMTEMRKRLDAWATLGCPGEFCEHDPGECPWDWIQWIDSGVLAHDGPLGGFDPDVMSPWTDDDGQQHWGVRGLQGCLSDLMPYRPAIFWTSAHWALAPKDVLERQSAELPYARLAPDDEDAQ